MSFLVGYIVIALSCIFIAVNALVSSVNSSPLWENALYLFFGIAWFSPIFIWIFQPKNIIPAKIYNFLAKGGYFLFGFAFLLTMFLIIRDVIWWLLYFAGSSYITSPNNFQILPYVNLITIAITFILSVYAVFEAEKMPTVDYYKYTDKRIKRPLKILLASDIHITKMISADKIRTLVEYFNRLKSDIILLPGDIADDKTEDISLQIAELKNLQAPRGIYYTVGNHEVYFDPFTWEGEFASLGWVVLHNSGVSIDNTGVYIAGVPDAMEMSADIKQAVAKAKSDEYRILLSHTPTTIKKISAGEVDLQVSGHTHGGQIFPFNLFTKWGNSGFLFGEYSVNGVKLLLSRGVGYWGPPMRLFAPNDIMLIELLPEK